MLKTIGIGMYLMASSSLWVNPEVTEVLQQDTTVGFNTVYKAGAATVLRSSLSYSQEEIDLLATNVYFEERTALTYGTITDEQAGQIVYVVLNRVKSKHFPDTVSDVIWQRKQFSWTHDGKSDTMRTKTARYKAYRITYKVLTGEIPNLVGDADHYINRAASRATWWRGMKFRGKYGNHWFYER